MSEAETPITWTQRKHDLAQRLGRSPTLVELMEEAVKHEMTPEEREAQRRSFVEAMMPTGDPRLD